MIKKIEQIVFNDQEDQQDPIAMTTLTQARISALFYFVVGLIIGGLIF